MTLGEETPVSRTAATSTRCLARAAGGATRTCFTMPCLALGEAKLDAIIALARKRCSDEKGQARKAGLQLLDALLVMRAAGSTCVLPSSSDVAVLEAATTDVLVSVRKAALSAMRSLLTAAPGAALLAALWIQSALPMIRDVETSLQELVLEQFQELLLARAAAAASTGRDGVPTSAARKAAAELLPLLAALGAGGAASRACVVRCISQLKAKQRLRAKQVIAGLQRVIETQIDAAGSSNGCSAGVSTNAITGAWLLYAEVAAADPAAPSWHFLQEQWEHVKGDIAGQSAGGGGSVPASASAAKLLRTIALAAAEFPGPQAQRLAVQLLQALHTFLLTPSAAAAHVAALVQLTTSHDDSAAAASMAQLLTAAEKVRVGG